MSELKSYTYTVLRYVHDITTGEFVNVGVALYSPDARYASAICRNTYGRLSKVFPDVDAAHFKSLMRYIQARFEELGERLSKELPLETARSVAELARRILPDDDSSLQWAPIGAGRTADPAAELDHLYDRMVMRYEEKTAKERRGDDDVWRCFKRTLETKQLLQYFQPRTVAVSDDEVEFEYTWQNGVLHCLEPVSFDLSTADGIREKAHKWLGQMSSIANAEEKFCVYFLVGQPQDEELHGAFQNAISILGKIPGQKEVILEDERDELSDRLARELAEHISQGSSGGQS